MIGRTTSVSASSVLSTQKTSMNPLCLEGVRTHIEIITYIFRNSIDKSSFGGSNHAIEVAHPFKTFRGPPHFLFADDLTHGFEVFLKTWIGFYSDYSPQSFHRVVNQFAVSNKRWAYSQTSLVITGHQSDLFFLLFLAQDSHPIRSHINKSMMTTMAIMTLYLCCSQKEGGII